MRITARVAVLACAFALISAGCATSEDVSLSLAEAPPASVEGNIVSLDLDAEGVEIVKADGDTSGDSGHYHVFIDRDPVAVGEVIPKEAGIVHSAEDPVMIYGLAPGEHEFTVVLGNGAHTRIHDVEETATVDVEGPSVDATAPATVEEGDDVTVQLTAKGVKIARADGKRSEDTGHFHIIVDPSSPPEAGEVIGAPKANKVIHTNVGRAMVSDLSKGEHTLWVVLGDGQHYAFDPPVMDKLTVTVG